MSDLGVNVENFPLHGPVPLVLAQCVNKKKKESSKQGVVKTQKESRL